MKFPASFPDTLPELTDDERQRVNDSLHRKLADANGWSDRHAMADDILTQNLRRTSGEGRNG